MKNNYSIFLQGLRFLKTVKYLPDFLLDDEVKWYRKCKIILLLIFMGGYLISPIDLLWDFLFFGLGYVEDIFVILFLLTYVCDELELYAEQKSLVENQETVCNFKNEKDCDIIDVEFVETDEDTNGKKR
jgi:RING finger protein 170